MTLSEAATSTHTIDSSALAELDTLRENGAWQAASELARSLLAINAEHAGVWALYAQVLLQLKQDAAAESAAQRAVALAPNDAVALRTLSTIRLRQQQIAAAAQLAEQALTQAPDCARTLTALASVRMAQQRLLEADQLLTRALQLSALAEIHLTRALFELRGNQSEAAIQHAQQALAQKPFLIAGWQLLAHLFHQTQRNADALYALQQVTHYVPNDAAAWSAYGAALQTHGQADQAVEAYQKALALNPNQAEIHNNLGVLYQQRDDWQQALQAFEQACRLQPDGMTFLLNCGIALTQLQRLPEAEAIVRHVLTLTPEHADAWNQLGNILVAAQRTDEALAAFEQALRIKSDHLPALNGIASALTAVGRIAHALDVHQHILKITENFDTRLRFTQCVRTVGFAAYDKEAATLLTRALNEAWCRPDELALACCSLIKLDPHLQKFFVDVDPADDYGYADLLDLSANALLPALLNTTAVCDAELERWLTKIRASLLTLAQANPAQIEMQLLDLHCALASQSFINDYLYSHDANQENRAAYLRDRLIEALHANAPVAAAWISAVASYFPLASIDCNALLLNRTWPAGVSALLRQQIIEPREELGYRNQMPALTAIDDDISRLVQQQYEENPYPKWSQTTPAGKPLSINRFLAQTFPHAAFHHLPEHDRLDVLIAGCGTGRQAIQAAQQFRNAQLLAIDLSRNSLAYAKRKTAALGLQNIDYAQADLLQLDTLERRFDLIEAVGVLHHLERPIDGWRKLRSLLRPHGLMRIGLYSQLGREPVSAAQRIAARHGYRANGADIKACRQQILALRDDPQLALLTSAFRDFYTLSECRDLLFHVQEQRYTLTRLKAELDELGLRFIGFIGLPAAVLNDYRQRFPADRSLTDLDCWDSFEREQLLTFIGMYQCWVQKID